MAVYFFSEEIRFSLPQKLKRKTWLKEIAEKEGSKIKELNFIFCSDEYLFQINVDYLNHHTYTDIITFDNSEKEGSIEGDIYISLDRIKENAQKHNQEIHRELSRVMSHGLFHLLGYKDKFKEESLIMRGKEEFAIELFEKI